MQSAKQQTSVTVRVDSVTVSVGVTGALLPSGQFTSLALTLPSPVGLALIPELVRTRLSIERADSLTNVLLVVNDVCAKDRGALLHDGDRVLLISPISGG